MLVHVSVTSAGPKLRHVAGTLWHVEAFPTNDSSNLVQGFHFMVVLWNHVGRGRCGAMSQWQLKKYQNDTLSMCKRIIRCAAPA